MDRQSQAYRELPINERVGDIELGAHAEAEYLGITSLHDIALPDDYEDDAWDRGRERPKTLEEARGALLDRILDPRAPDGDEVLGVYDRKEV